MNFDFLFVRERKDKLIFCKYDLSVEQVTVYLYYEFESTVVETSTKYTRLQCTPAMLVLTKTFNSCTASMVMTKYNTSMCRAATIITCNFACNELNMKLSKFVHGLKREYCNDSVIL